MKCCTVDRGDTVVASDIQGNINNLKKVATGVSVNNCQYAERISAQHPILRETVARGALVIKWGQHQYVMQFHIKVRTRNMM